MVQWSVDVNGYYSDVNTKYITYSDTSAEPFFVNGLHALRNALAIGQILKRTLILPKFQCLSGGYCPLNCFIMIKNFDRYFDYRESEFLNHRLVPNHVREPQAVYNAARKISAGWHQMDDRQILKALHYNDVRMSTIASQITIFNCLFRRRSKKTSKLRVTGLCVGKSPETGKFPAQMASDAENVSIWWRHHEVLLIPQFCTSVSYWQVPQ